jgi:uncharacterized glyoxalase superfamily protein PhnB
MATKSKRKAVRTKRVRARGATKKSTRQTSPRAAVRRSAAKKPSNLDLRSVNPSLTVNDLEASIAWYRDVLGFGVKERWEHDGKLAGVEVAAGKVSFYLLQDDWKKGRERAKGEGFRLHCTTAQNVDQLAEKIRERGGHLVHEPHDEPWGGRAFAVADPTGFKITITGA